MLAPHKINVALNVAFNSSDFIHNCTLYIHINYACVYLDRFRFSVVAFFSAYTPPTGNSHGGVFYFQSKRFSSTYPKQFNVSDFFFDSHSVNDGHDHHYNLECSKSSNILLLIYVNYSLSHTANSSKWNNIPKLLKSMLISECGI